MAFTHRPLKLQYFVNTSISIIQNAQMQKIALIMMLTMEIAFDRVVVSFEFEEMVKWPLHAGLTAYNSLIALLYILYMLYLLYMLYMPLHAGLTAHNSLVALPSQY